MSFGLIAENAWIFRRRCSTFDEPKRRYWAAREERKKVSQFDLIRSIERFARPERKSHLLTIEEKEKSAALPQEADTLSFLPFGGTLTRCTKFPLFQGAERRICLKLPLEEKHLYSKSPFAGRDFCGLGRVSGRENDFG